MIFMVYSFYFITVNTLTLVTLRWFTMVYLVYYGLLDFLIVLFIRLYHNFGEKHSLIDLFYLLRVITYLIHFSKVHWGKINIKSLARVGGRLLPQKKAPFISFGSPILDANKIKD